MIDCGASNNFISKDLFRVEETKAYLIEVGDGHMVKCQGKCAKLRFYMQQLEVIEDFYLFGLRGVDFVLGLKLLAGLREVKADFGRTELTVKRGLNNHNSREPLLGIHCLEAEIDPLIR
ncbi:hypothetical protein Lal_00028315, partial [Lupinus albus]